MLNKFKEINPEKLVLYGCVFALALSIVYYLLHNFVFLSGDFELYCGVLYPMVLSGIFLIYFVVKSVRLYFRDKVIFDYFQIGLLFYFIIGSFIIVSSQGDNLKMSDWLRIPMALLFPGVYLVGLSDFWRGAFYNTILIDLDDVIFSIALALPLVSLIGEMYNENKNKIIVVIKRIVFFLVLISLLIGMHSCLSTTW